MEVKIEQMEFESYEENPARMDTSKRNVKKRARDRQKLPDQREDSSCEITDLFHGLSSWSKERAESQKRFESILSRCIIDVLDQVQDLKEKYSSVTKERDDLLETVMKRSREIKQHDVDVIKERADRDISLIIKERDDLLETVIKQSNEIGQLKEIMSSAKKLLQPEKTIRLHDTQNSDEMDEELPSNDKRKENNIVNDGEKKQKEQIPIPEYECDKCPFKTTTKQIMVVHTVEFHHLKIKPKPNNDKDIQARYSRGPNEGIAKTGVSNKGNKVDHEITANNVEQEDLNAQPTMDSSWLSNFEDTDVNKTEEILVKEHVVNDPLKVATIVKENLNKKPLLLRKSNSSRADVELEFSCEICLYKARTKIALREHIEMQHLGSEIASIWSYGSEKPGNASFQRMKKVKKLKEEAAPPVTEKRFQCEQCPYHSKQRGALMTHFNKNHAATKGISKVGGIYPAKVQNMEDSSTIDKERNADIIEEMEVQDNVANDPLETLNKDQTEAVNRKNRRKPLLLKRSYDG